jgi:hypothetical protein
MSPGYTYLTLGQARTELANRLQDPTYAYWTAQELSSLIIEAVHAWQALTAAYKQRATLTLSPGGGVDGSSFYDLTALPSGILRYSVTDQQLISMVLTHLLEPPLISGWTGTGQFAFSQITQALQNRLNRFLGDTGCVITRNLQFFLAAPPQSTRTFLPEAVLDIRRAAWINVDAAYSVLWRDDEYAMQAFLNSGAVTPADPPLVWGKFTIPPVGIQLYPSPLNDGQVETLVVTSGAQIGQTPAAVANTPVILGIPDDFCWGLTFGTLSDLFSADGPGKDAARAEYAESRYQEAVELMRLNPLLLQTQINEVPIWSGSVFEMDAYLSNWQAAPGEPEFAGMAGRNLVAFGATPNDIFSATVDVVSNIPVPTSDASPLQVNRGAIDPLLDYAQHLASIKLGAAEVASTQKLRQNFLVNAALENARITKGSFYKSALTAPVFRQQAEVPRI